MADTQSIVAVDLDGDGEDLISASNGDGKIAWYENTDGTGTFGAPLWGSTMTVPPEVAVQAVSASGSMFVDPPATVVDDDETAGTITIALDEPPAAGPTQLEQGLGRAFVAYNDPAQAGFATEFPVAWTAGDLLRLTSEIRATSATAANPVDVIATGWQTATNELGGFDFSFRGQPGDLMDRAASPRDDTTAGNSTYTSFFYTHNATAADLGILINADRVRGVVDFFNRTDLAGALGAGILSDPVQLRSMAIERIVYNEGAFGPRP